MTEEASRAPSPRLRAAFGRYRLGFSGSGLIICGTYYDFNHAANLGEAARAGNEGAEEAAQDLVAFLQTLRGEDGRPVPEERALAFVQGMELRAPK